MAPRCAAGPDHPCRRPPPTAPRPWVFALLLLAGAIGAEPGHADQNDPRLEALFERIQRVEDPQAAARIERSIWAIWVDAGDDEVNELMDAGMQAMASARIERAIELFSRVIEKSPRFAEGWNKRATALYLNGELAASVRDIERTLALEPRHFGAVSGMGLIFLRRGDKIGALKAFKRVLEINPHAPGAREHVRILEDALKGEGA